MDRQLAERMVGAACLLAVLVLVVPAVLDGNRDSGATISHPSAEEALNLRTHTIRLDRAERDPPVPTAGQAAKDTQSSAQPVAEPVPPPDIESRTDTESAPAPTAAVPAAASGSDAAKSAPLREAVRSPGPEPIAGGPGWFVQLGSFSQRDNAERLATALQGKGFSASVLGGGGASGTLFRVRAGPEPDRAAADALADRLAAAGFPGGRVGRP